MATLGVNDELRFSDDDVETWFAVKKITEGGAIWFGIFETEMEAYDHVRYEFSDYLTPDNTDESVASGVDDIGQEFKVVIESVSIILEVYD